VWERPARWCGRDAYTDFPGGLYAWLITALDPTWEGARIFFPDNLAGPDIVAVLRDAARRRVMVVLVQVKFEKRVDADHALLTVDPEKLHTVNRGAAPGRGKGQEHGIAKYDAQRDAFLAKIAGTPVARVLVSGKATVDEVGTDVVPHARGGAAPQDLRIVLDGAQLDSVFGNELARLVRGLRRVPEVRQGGGGE